MGTPVDTSKPDCKRDDTVSALRLMGITEGQGRRGQAAKMPPARVEPWTSNSTISSSFHYTTDTLLRSPAVSVYTLYF